MIELRNKLFCKLCGRDVEYFGADYIGRDSIVSTYVRCHGVAFTYNIPMGAQWTNWKAVAQQAWDKSLDVPVGRAVEAKAPPVDHLAKRQRKIDLED